MERINRGNSNLKLPSSNAGTNMKEINQLKNNNKNCCNKVKNLWDLSSESNGAAEADLLGLFSWPPRSYTCSFCKREFRSAQALGGHMNVHRRDRARLRQSPPRDHSPYNSPLNLNLDPNPNFSFNSKPSLSSAKPPLISSLPSFNIPPSVSTISTTPPATVTEMRKWGNANFAELNTHHSSPMISQDFIMKSKATKRLFELENFGLLVHEKEAAAAAALEKSDIVRLELEIGLFGEVKEDLDLELRLGCI